MAIDAKAIEAEATCTLSLGNPNNDSALVNISYSCTQEGLPTTGGAFQMNLFFEKGKLGEGEEGEKAAYAAARKILSQMSHAAR